MPYKSCYLAVVVGSVTHAVGRLSLRSPTLCHNGLSRLGSSHIHFVSSAKLRELLLVKLVILPDQPSVRQKQLSFRLGAGLSNLSVLR